MANQGYTETSNEQQAIMNKRLSFKVFIKGSTTAASITAVTTNNPGFRVWLESQSLTAPSNANFSGLASSATPSVIGIYGYVDDALRLHGVSIPTNSIKSASITAVVVTNKGATHDITGNTGVTSDNNIAFQCSLTGGDLDAAAINHEFTVELCYDAYAF